MITTRLLVRCSLDLDAGGFCDRRPLLEFRLDKCGEFPRRCNLWRHAELDHAGLHLRHLHAEARRQDGNSKHSFAAQVVAPSGLGLRRLGRPLHCSYRYVHTSSTATWRRRTTLLLQSAGLSAHSSWKPVAFTIGAHFCSSRASNAAKSFGEPVTGSKPSFAMLALRSEDLRLSLTSPLSLPTTSAARPAGPRIP